ncbi:hormonally up-regulated Neu-associated kinase, partial [Dimargaris cristalligena]
QRIIKQLLTALVGVHHKHITHLDINPANLMSDGNDNLVLIDFGLASKCSAGQCLPSCGTPGFVAPEVLAGTGTGPKADMYSVGVVLGMML